MSKNTVFHLIKRFDPRSIFFVLIPGIILYNLYIFNMSYPGEARQPFPVAIGAVIPFVILAVALMLFPGAGTGETYDLKRKYCLKESVLAFLISWSCFTWVVRIISFSGVERGAPGTILLSGLYLVLFFNALLVLFFTARHPFTIRFLKFHRGLIVVIILALLVRFLMVLAYPFLVVRSDGGDGGHFYGRIWQMAQGFYQGNLNFVTGYPFFMSFPCVLLRGWRSYQGLPLLFFQHLLGVLMPAFLYHIVWLHTKDKKAAIVVGIISALSLQDALWAHRTRPAFMGALLAAASMWSFSVWVKRYPGFRWIALTGILLSCATLTRNFPIVFLGCFVVMICVLKGRTLKRKVIAIAFLLTAFFSCYYAYVYFVQYLSTGMFAMRGMGVGIFNMHAVTYRQDPEKIPFDRNAGEYTDKMVAYSHCIREDLPRIPREYWSVTIFDKKDARAPEYLTEELKASVSTRSRHRLPYLEKERDKIYVDKVEFAYYLGVPGMKKLIDGYCYEQVKSAPLKYLDIVYRRIIQAFRVYHEDFVFKYRYFPELKKIEVIAKMPFGFCKVKWPLPHSKDAKIQYSNVYAVHIIEWFYRNVVYDWWIYLGIVLVLLKDMLKRTSLGLLSGMCIFLVCSFIFFYSFIRLPHARHMTIVSPFYDILFGLAVYRIAASAAGIVMKLLRPRNVEGYDHI